MTTYTLTKEQRELILTALEPHNSTALRWVTEVDAALALLRNLQPNTQEPAAYKVWRAMCEPHLSDRKEKDAISNEPLYTAQALKDVLEQAAKRCDLVGCWPSLGPKQCAESIREMIGEIK